MSNTSQDNSPSTHNFIEAHIHIHTNTHTHSFHPTIEWMRYDVFLISLLNYKVRQLLARDIPLFHSIHQWMGSLIAYCLCLLLLLYQNIIK